MGRPCSFDLCNNNRKTVRRDTKRGEFPRLSVEVSHFSAEASHFAGRPDTQTSTTTRLSGRAAGGCTTVTGVASEAQGSFPPAGSTAFRSARASCGISTLASDAGASDWTAADLGQLRGDGRVERLLLNQPRQGHLQLIVEAIDLIGIEHEREDRRLLGMPRIDDDAL